ncbi:MAG: ABC transporter substrate-binding protein [Pseudomonadota bacterium]
MNLNSTLIAELAPKGKLRASINLGNPILANQHPDTGAPVGVSIDLANELARRLGTGIELVVFDTALKSANALKGNEVDIGFVAIDPLRSDGISFTPPYVQIEGSYMVRNESAITKNAQVDQPGIRVAVGAGSAYDLYLTRTLQHADIVRAPTSPAVIDTFVENNLEVAAGVRQQLESDALRVPGMRLLDGRFMVIHQAMGTPKSRSAEAVKLLVEFIEEMKESGFVAASLARHQIKGAVVAPPGYPAA